MEVAVGGLEDLGDRLERDEFDLVAVGRALITNPNWANTFERAVLINCGRSPARRSKPSSSL